eukprot:scaffold208843_cov20-Prasinocladus_malaysianus.AAC.1
MAGMHPSPKLCRYTWLKFLLILSAIFGDQLSKLNTTEWTKKLPSAAITVTSFQLIMSSRLVASISKNNYDLHCVGSLHGRQTPPAMHGLVPGENGQRCDLRWLEMTDPGGQQGLRLRASRPSDETHGTNEFHFGASRFSMAALAEAIHNYQASKHNTDTTSKC